MANTLSSLNEQILTDRCLLPQIGRQTSAEFGIKRVEGAVRWMRSNRTVVDCPGVKSPVQLVARVIPNETDGSRIVASFIPKEQMQTNDGKCFRPPVC